MEARPSAGTHQARSHGPHQHQAVSPVEVTALGVVLVCHQTSAGSWICCAESDEAHSCARGFSPANAAARWELAQVLPE
jgi:hypothetical protein